MSEWRQTTIGEIAEIFDGPHATPTKTDSGPWFLSISSLQNGRLVLGESAHLSESDFERWTRRVTPQEGDLLFSYETKLGAAALMPAGLRACLGRRMAILRPRREQVDPRFLLYSYIGPEFQEVIRQRCVHGATVDRILLSEMATWPISVPPLEVQVAIGRILGALDDKIAVNERISLSYERILRAEFERLGVDEEEAGDREVRSVSDFVEFNPKTPTPSGAEAVYLDMSSVPTEKARVERWDRRPPRSGTRFMNGDTVMARITPCLENGKTAYIDFMADGEVGVGSTEFIVLRPRPGVPAHFPYFLARSERFRSVAIRAMVGSSGRQRVSVNSLIDYRISVPDKERLGDFGVLAAEAFAHVNSLDAESKNLRVLRDALLPKLMSGEIRVRDAEKIVEDVT